MKDKAGIRFNPSKYAELELDEKIILTTEIDGVVTQYDVGAGGDIEVEPLEVVDNGTFDAGSGKAYNPVTVNVDAPVYEEVLLWENNAPSKGFDTDKLLIKFNRLAPEYTHYKLVVRNINNAPDTYSVIVPVETILNGNLIATSYDVDNDFCFGRQLMVGMIEISSDPPLFEEWLFAYGKCNQVGADNPKRFRAIPLELYGVKGLAG